MPTKVSTRVNGQELGWVVAATGCSVHDTVEKTWRAWARPSIFMDLTKRRVMFATEGRDASTVHAFAADPLTHDGEPTTQIERVCCDMSPAFIKGITGSSTSAPRQMTFRAVRRFHRNHSSM